MKRKNIYDQLSPICGVERKHNGFLLHFGADDKVRVDNSREARQEALKRLHALMEQHVTAAGYAPAADSWVPALITELENYLEEYAA